MALVAIILGVAHANVYDLYFPKYTSTCSNGCAPWTNAPNKNYTQAQINAMWFSTDVQSAAGSNCAMPGASAGNHECDCSDANEVIADSFAGPWCFCANPSATDPIAAYCEAPKSVPEQINLQLAAPDVAVVSFVTFEDMPSSPPIATLSTSADSNGTTINGVSHEYTIASANRTWILNFVKFSGLLPHQTYYYKVKSGSAECEWSAQYRFRAGYSQGITRVATYGDMGHSAHNNMENMMNDCNSGAIDAIVHMGDHCYNLDMANDRRGDAYMNAFQPVLSQCLWMPIIGNHEASDGDHFNRYLNMTWGEIYGNNPPVHSTATTRLGHLLSKATLYGAAVHGPTPTLNSRYISSDFGLLHMVGLDLNNLDADQVAWLEADLAAANANRDAVPWIMVMSHFPIHHTSASDNLNASAAYYMGDASEHYATSGHEFKACDSDDCKTVGRLMKDFQSVLHPIFVKYGVDIYNAGHVHSYETTWPLCANGTECQQNYINPKGTVHITEGNGGVPGVHGTNSVTDCGSKHSWCRKTGTGGAYARITAYNYTHLTYDHVENPTGNVSDSWTIVQATHGPFDPNDHF